MVFLCSHVGWIPNREICHKPEVNSALFNESLKQSEVDLVSTSHNIMPSYCEVLALHKMTKASVNGLLLLFFMHGSSWTFPKPWLTTPETDIQYSHVFGTSHAEATWTIVAATKEPTILDRGQWDSIYTFNIASPETVYQKFWTYCGQIKAFC